MSTDERKEEPIPELKKAKNSIGSFFSKLGKKGKSKGHDEMKKNESTASIRTANTVLSLSEGEDENGESSQNPLNSTIHQASLFSYKFSENRKPTSPELQVVKESKAERTPGVSIVNPDVFAPQTVMDMVAKIHDNDPEFMDLVKLTSQATNIGDHLKSSSLQSQGIDLNSEPKPEVLDTPEELIITQDTQQRSHMCKEYIEKRYRVLDSAFQQNLRYNPIDVIRYRLAADEKDAEGMRIWKNSYIWKVSNNEMMNYYQNYSLIQKAMQEAKLRKPPPSPALRPFSTVHNPVSRLSSPIDISKSPLPLVVDNTTKLKMLDIPKDSSDKGKNNNKDPPTDTFKRRLSDIVTNESEKEIVAGPISAVESKTLAFSTSRESLKIKSKEDMQNNVSYNNPTSTSTAEKEITRSKSRELGPTEKSKSAEISKTSNEAANIRNVQTDTLPRAESSKSPTVINRNKSTFKEQKLPDNPVFPGRQLSQMSSKISISNYELASKPTEPPPKPSGILHSQTDLRSFSRKEYPRLNSHQPKKSRLQLVVQTARDSIEELSSHFRINGSENDELASPTVSDKSGLSSTTSILSKGDSPKKKKREKSPLKYGAEGLKRFIQSVKKMSSENLSSPKAIGPSDQVGLVESTDEQTGNAIDVLPFSEVEEGQKRIKTKRKKSLITENQLLSQIQEMIQKSERLIPILQTNYNKYDEIILKVERVSSDYLTHPTQVLDSVVMQASDSMIRIEKMNVNFDRMKVEIHQIMKTLEHDILELTSLASNDVSQKIQDIEDFIQERELQTTSWSTEVGYTLIACALQVLGFMIWMWYQMFKIGKVVYKTSKQIVTGSSGRIAASPN